MVQIAIASCRSNPTAESVQAELQSVENDTSVNRTIVFRELGARAAVALLIQRYGTSIESIQWTSLSPIALGYDDTDTLISIECLEQAFGTRRFERPDAAILLESSESYAQTARRESVTNEAFAYALGDLVMK